MRYRPIRPRDQRLHGSGEYWRVDVSAKFIIWVLSVLCLSQAGLWSIMAVCERVFEARHGIRQNASDFYDRLCNVREVTRLRTALAAERARADRLAVELATLRGMNHMCTALANRVGAYNS